MRYTSTQAENPFNDFIDPVHNEGTSISTRPNHVVEVNMLRVFTRELATDLMLQLFDWDYPGITSRPLEISQNNATFTDCCLTNLTFSPLWSTTHLNFYATRILRSPREENPSIITNVLESPPSSDIIVQQERAKNLTNIGLFRMLLFDTYGNIIFLPQSMSHLTFFHLHRQYGPYNALFSDQQRIPPNLMPPFFAPQPQRLWTHRTILSGGMYKANWTSLVKRGPESMQFWQSDLVDGNMTITNATAQAQNFLYDDEYYVTIPITIPNTSAINDLLDKALNSGQNEVLYIHLFYQPNSATKKFVQNFFDFTKYTTNSMNNSNSPNNNNNNNQHSNTPGDIFMSYIKHSIQGNEGDHVHHITNLPVTPHTFKVHQDYQALYTKTITPNRTTNLDPSTPPHQRYEDIYERISYYELPPFPGTSWQIVNMDLSQTFPASLSAIRIGDAYRHEVFSFQINLLLLQMVIQSQGHVALHSAPLTFASGGETTDNIGIVFPTKGITMQLHIPWKGVK